MNNRKREHLTRLTRRYEAVARVMAGHTVAKIARDMGVGRVRVEQMVAANAGPDFLAQIAVERRAR